MSEALTNAQPARRVPAWHRRWLVVVRLRRDVLFEYPNLFGLWLRRRAAFWQYVLGLEESRLVREAARRGDACPVRRPLKAPRPGDWRGD